MRCCVTSAENGSGEITSEGSDDVQTWSESRTNNPPLSRSPKSSSSPDSRNEMSPWLNCAPVGGYETAPEVKWSCGHTEGSSVMVSPAKGAAGRMSSVLVAKAGHEKRSS